MKKLILVGIAAFLSASVMANVIAVSNTLNGATGPATSIDSSTIYAFTFTTGDLTSYDITEFSLLNGDGQDPAVAGVNATLYSEDRSQQIGSVISFPTTLDNEIIVFDFSGDPVSVAGSSTYRIEISAATDGWNMPFTADSSAQGDIALVGNGWSIATTHETSVDAGANWTEGIAGGAISSITVIPEPATLSLIALVGGGLVFVRRWFLI